MLLPAKCPECGGLIEVRSEMKAVNCPLCKKAIVVEEAVNYFNTYFNVEKIYNTKHTSCGGTSTNTHEDNSNDFVIVGGVLKEYRGAGVDVVIPDGVLEIGQECFKELKIKSVVIPNSVTSIGGMAFMHCTNLTSIIIPDSVPYIGPNAFEGCTNLTSVSIPEGVETIGFCTFMGCKKLASVTIPNSVTRIEFGAFKDCTNLASVTISNSKTVINNPFEGTPYQAERIATAKRTEAEQQRIISERKHKGLCRHCGGAFEGFLSKKCSRCDRPKDY